MYAAMLHDPDRVRKPGPIGTPIQGVDMRVVDDEGTELPVGQTGQIGQIGRREVSPPQDLRQG